MAAAQQADVSIPGVGTIFFPEGHTELQNVMYVCMYRDIKHTPLNYVKLILSTKCCNE